MYVYIQSEKCLWTVGFYSPDGEWHPESDHDNQLSAANRVAYLNGGVPAPAKFDGEPTFVGYTKLT